MPKLKLKRQSTRHGGGKHVTSMKPGNGVNLRGKKLKVTKVKKLGLPTLGKSIGSKGSKGVKARGGKVRRAKVGQITAASVPGAKTIGPSARPKQRRSTVRVAPPRLGSRARPMDRRNNNQYY